MAQQGNYMMPVMPPPQAAAAQGAGAVLKAGTVVPLKLSEAAKGKKIAVGQRVPLTVAADVKLGAAVVIPAGASAEGEVTAQSGATLSAKPLYVRVGNKLARLSGTFDGGSGRVTLTDDVKLTN
jgi:hypothetical protein